MIGDGITITVLDVKGDNIRLGITAPRDVQVFREELLTALSEANASCRCWSRTRAAPCPRPDHPGDLGTPSPLRLGGAAAARSPGPMAATPLSERGEGTRRGAPAADPVRRAPGWPALPPARRPRGARAGGGPGPGGGGRPVRRVPRRCRSPAGPPCGCAARSWTRSGGSTSPPAPCAARHGTRPPRRSGSEPARPRRERRRDRGGPRHRPEELADLRGRVHQSLVLSLDAPAGGSEDDGADVLGSSSSTRRSWSRPSCWCRREQESYLSGRPRLPARPDARRRARLLPGGPYQRPVAAERVTESRVSSSARRAQADADRPRGAVRRPGARAARPAERGVQEQAAYAAALADRSSFAARVSEPARPGRTRSVPA